MRRTLILLVLLACLAGLAGLVLTRPGTVAPEAIAGLTGDATRGEIIFHAGGCASCHMAPDTEDKRVLAGGLEIASPFGTFLVPNISSDTDHGIGSWSDLDLVNAVMKGTSPEGQHYYPAFPYTSYARGSLQDTVDLAAYLRTLPADPTPSQPHRIGFPFNIRASLGGWKLLFFRDGWVTPEDFAATDELTLGRSLVEGWGHCGECHTPRNALGGPDFDQWLAGGPNPSGDGTIPNIRPAALRWSANDIAAYLATGFTPDFDSAGGEMTDVIRNMAELPDGHLEAIAAYLTTLPE